MKFLVVAVVLETSIVELVLTKVKPVPLKYHTELVPFKVIVEFEIFKVLVVG